VGNISLVSADTHDRRRRCTSFFTRTSDSNKSLSSQVQYIGFSAVSLTLAWCASYVDSENLQSTVRFYAPVNNTKKFVSYILISAENTSLDRNVSRQKIFSSSIEIYQATRGLRTTLRPGRQWRIQNFAKVGDKLRRVVRT